MKDLVKDKVMKDVVKDVQLDFDVEGSSCYSVDIMFCFFVIEQVL